MPRRSGDTSDPVASSPPDAAIDGLYQLPPDEFVAARNELARRSGRDEARVIRALPKPNVVAWALNQVYWTARPVFERLVEAASHLREAQAGALLGRQHDLRGAGAGHRKALTEAVEQATSRLAAAGHTASPDTIRSLTAAFEAVPWTDRAGRLDRPPSPPGFAALAGLPVAPSTEEAVQGAPEDRGPKVEDHAVQKKSVGDRQDREQELRAERLQEQQARSQRALAELAHARAEVAASADRLRASEERLVQAREADRVARDRAREAGSELEEAEGVYRAAEREASAADAALRKAEAAVKPNGR